MNKRLPVCLSILLLSGCGTLPQDRAVSGAGIGAGAGAVLGAITGLTVLEGAALGAAAGGLTGVLTDSRDLDLGSPAWKRGSAGDSAANYDSTTAAVQSRLNALGYKAGRVDGLMGPRTRAAIRAFQRDNGLLVDGEATPALVDHLSRYGG